MSNEEHCESHCCEEEISPKKIVLAIVLFVAAILVEHLIHIKNMEALTKGISLCLYAVSYLLCGFDVLKEAVESLFKGKCFNEEFLMALATVGAIVIGEYSEAVAVMILFEIGEFLEEKASEKTKKSISKLMDIRPDIVCVRRDNKEILVDAKDVKVGEIIVVKPGERVPLDGKISSGKSTVDTSALTGESVPRLVEVNSVVLSGFVNISGVIELVVEKEFSESTVSRILEMVENAQEKKAHAEKLISRFAKVYTPIVCLVALALAIIVPLVLGGGAGIWKTWIYRACEMLVVSCPCALVISVPLSFFSGIGLASKQGILIKGSSYIEFLSKVETVVFDKTGTLTKGVFVVSEIGLAENAEITNEELVSLITHAEYYSEHPISKSLKSFHQCELCGKLTIEEAEEISGHGIKCILDGKKIVAGNKKLMQLENIKNFKSCEQEIEGSIIYVASNGIFLGWIIISDIVKDDSKESISLLHKMGIKKTVMLTGDSENNANKVAKKLGIDSVRAELLPLGKVQEIENLLEQNKNTNNKIMFVGDGINDAPVLTRSDVGVAMGALGSDAAIEAADVVIMDDKMVKIPAAIKVAKKTMLNVQENITVSLGLKIIILALCAFGFANMWAAVFGDVGVCMLTILNSLRLFKSKS